LIREYHYPSCILFCGCCNDAMPLGKMGSFADVLPVPSDPVKCYSFHSSTLFMHQWNLITQMAWNHASLLRLLCENGTMLISTTFQSIQKLIYCEGCIHRATVLPSVFYRRRFKPPSSLAALKTANTHVHHLATIFAVQPICSVVHACL
jgi:hypothetical protein